jgi:regulator of nucleoside diphosphate kinase
VRPQIQLLASESDLVASLALRTEDRNPVVAAMLLEEIERAELHDAATLPEDAVRLGSQVDFVDDKTSQLRKVRIVLPGEANIAEGRISILTPMGAALYGLRAGSSIDWPDLDGNKRRINIVRVVQRVRKT